MAMGRLNNPFRQPDSVPLATVCPEATQAVVDDVLPSPDLPLREMTGFEEEYIEQHAADNNTIRLVNEILTRCLVPVGEDPVEHRQRVDNLLVADRDAALIKLRQLSIGNTVDTEIDCPQCGETSEVHFDLTQLPVIFARPSKRITLTVGDGITVVLRLPTAADQAALFDTNLEGEAQKLSWLLARLLVQFGTKQAPFDLRFVQSLPISQRRAIESASRVGL